VNAANAASSAQASLEDPTVCWLHHNRQRSMRNERSNVYAQKTHEKPKSWFEPWIVDSHYKLVRKMSR
jgi:hypothetical protein